MLPVYPFYSAGATCRTPTPSSCVYKVSLMCVCFVGGSQIHSDATSHMYVCTRSEVIILPLSFPHLEQGFSLRQSRVVLHHTFPFDVVNLMHIGRMLKPLIESF